MKKSAIIKIVTLLAILVIAYFLFNQEKAIEIVDLEKFTLDCHKSEQPWDKQNCEFVEKDESGFTYIPDEGEQLNQMKAPFTKEEFKVELIETNLWEPWDFEFLPDGSILSTQKGGSIVNIKEGVSKEVYNVKPILLFETGLLGLAIDPEFSENEYVYIQYTYSLAEGESDLDSDKGGTKALNKISRFIFDGDSFTEEKVLLDNIPASAWHAGGRLEFGPDGKLYATTGDGNELLKPQDFNFLGGKILRLNKDGSVPEDNPVPNSYVYSLGHRNPQGIAWDPITGDLYESEHGPVSFDEINRILPGKNYGWGSYKCDRVKGEIIEEKIEMPVVCINEYTLAPSGMEFVSDESSPWYGDLFVASLRARHIHRYRFENDQVVLDEIFFVSEGLPYTKDFTGKIDRRIRDIEYHDGSLYAIGDYFGLVKITPI